MRDLIQRGVPKATAEAAAASLPPGLSPYARGVVQKHFEAYALRRGWVDVRDPAQVRRRSPQALGNLGSGCAQPCVALVTTQALLLLMLWLWLWL